MSSRERRCTPPGQDVPDIIVSFTILLALGMRSSFIVTLLQLPRTPAWTPTTYPVHNESSRTLCAGGRLNSLWQPPSPRRRFVCQGAVLYADSPFRATVLRFGRLRTSQAETRQQPDGWVLQRKARHPRLLMLHPQRKSGIRFQLLKCQWMGRQQAARKTHVP